MDKTKDAANGLWDKLLADVKARLDKGEKRMTITVQHGPCPDGQTFRLQGLIGPVALTFGRAARSGRPRSIPTRSTTT